jgi:uncharacterized protein YndB with AHSA1/START domain
MSTAPVIPPIRGTITVHVPVERAFRVFTDSFGAWWPPEYHIGHADMADAILEPSEGGRWYERGVDGSECEWGRVLAWEPPHRLVVTWQIDGQWRTRSSPPLSAPDGWAA